MCVCLCAEGARASVFTEPGIDPGPGIALAHQLLLQHHDSLWLAKKGETERPDRAAHSWGAEKKKRKKKKRKEEEDEE